MIQKIDVNTLKSSVDLVELVGRHTELKLASRAMGEHHGPCPQCGGTDRFIVQSNKFMCRRCHERWGDAIEYVMWLDGLDFAEACQRLAPGSVPMDVAAYQNRPKQKRTSPPPKPVQPPAERWQARARKLIDRAEAVLWSEQGELALGYLRKRGFTDDTIRTARLGCIPNIAYDSATAWGIDGDKVKLPEGILIPWLGDNGQVLQLRVRLPKGATDVDGKPQKYTSIRGSAGSNPLYNAVNLDPTRAAVIVEGEFDALSIQQTAGNIVTPVATGSVTAARALKWVLRLTACPAVLVAFDSDESGDAAAGYWTKKLGCAIRWKPTRYDVNDMLTVGDDIRSWILDALPEQQKPKFTLVFSLDGCDMAALPYHQVADLATQTVAVTFFFDAERDDTTASFLTPESTQVDAIGDWRDGRPDTVGLWQIDNRDGCRVINCALETGLESLFYIEYNMFNPVVLLPNDTRCRRVRANADWLVREIPF